MFCFACVFKAEALNIPVVMSWDNSNTSSYNSQQTGKELTWNEFYRIGIAIDSLAYKQLSTSLSFYTVPDFLDNNVLLKDFDMHYNLSAWDIFAMSQIVGYGLPNQLNPHSLVSAINDSYLYQETRFNGLGLSYGKAGVAFAAALGGNVHNQAINYWTVDYFNKRSSLKAGLKQEFRSLDSHWRSPVSISSLSAEYWDGLLHLNAVSALSYFVEHERTDSHTGIFAQGEANIASSPSSYIYIAAMAKDIEPSNQLLQDYRLAYHQGFGRISVSPELAACFLPGMKDYRASVLGEWNLSTHGRIGVFYKLNGRDTDNLTHSFGLQAALQYEL